MPTVFVKEFMIALKNNMKYLKIDDNKGLYWDGTAYQEIDKINKAGLLVLLNAAEKDDFELDRYDEKLLGNKAHQVIYENIYSKFEQFLSDKDHFKTEVDNMYKDALNKYGAEEAEDFDDEASSPEEENKDIDSDDLPF